MAVAVTLLKICECKGKQNFTLAHPNMKKK